MMTLFMLLSLLWYVIILGGGFYLVLRFVRAFERRGTERKELEELRERVLHLEESLDTVTSDMERLVEEQRFTVKLLSERTDPPDP